LQPSIDNSEIRQEDGKSKMNSSNFANSVLEEMCHEISDIKIRSEVNEIGTNKNISIGASMNGQSAKSISENRSSANGIYSKEELNSRKRRQKSIESNHQQFLFPEYINETDFLNH
jgi:hypothetical protein